MNTNVYDRYNLEEIFNPFFLNSNQVFDEKLFSTQQYTI